MNAPTRPILRYHGGKWKLAPWVIEHFPPHRVYVEPFCGAASVLAQKPRINHEVINDLNGRLVNLFRLLRDPAASAKLVELVYLTLYSDAEYRLATEPADDLLEDARRLLVLGGQAYSSCAAAGGSSGKLTTWRRRISERCSGPASTWADLPEVMLGWIDRLRGVNVENDDALAVLKRWDAKDVLFYVDPPYLAATRNNKGRGYAHEMTDDQHCELAAVLHEAKGMVVLSGYHSALYDRLYKGWRQFETDGFADKGGKRTEVLWLNPAAERALRAGAEQMEMF